MGVRGAKARILVGVKPPDASTARVNDSLNLEGCEKECLNDCNCRAYATANVSAGGSGCLSWYGDLMDIRTLAQGGQDLFVRVDAIILGMRSYLLTKLIIQAYLEIIQRN